MEGQAARQGPAGGVVRCSSRGAWHHERAAAVIDAAEATLRLWGGDGMDFDTLAADIAIEARRALTVTDEIKALDQRITEFYEQVDPGEILRLAKPHPRCSGGSLRLNLNVRPAAIEQSGLEQQ